MQCAVLQAQPRDRFSGVLLARWLAFAVSLTLAACASLRTAEPGSRLHLVSAADNDLVVVLRENGQPFQRHDSLEEALATVAPGDALMVLADGYPATCTELTEEQLDRIDDREMRVFLEFPSRLPGLELGAIRATQLERAVVTSGRFGDALEPMRLLAIHDGHFTPVDPAPGDALLAFAKVAGYDTAVYGIEDTEAHPILFEHPGRPDLLVATTKLSQFVTARYAPQDAWQAIWSSVLEWLQPERGPVALDWTPEVRPSFGRDEPLPRSAVRDAVIRGVDWHTNANMLVDASWDHVYDEYRSTGVVDPAHPTGPAPDPAWAAGDGTHGLLEGVQSTIYHDGRQDVRWWRRSDSNGESALAFALRSKLDGDARSATIAANLMDWIYERSGLFIDDATREDFGLVHWAHDSKSLYGDNDIKIILSAIGSAAVLGEERWNERILQNITANFRTTGRLGFRGGALNADQLNQNGWTSYWRGWLTHYAPHFEAWIWASYLWAYDKTGDPLFLERTRDGIGRMMAAYPDGWRWTNGIQQERGRMLLTLAWLIRVDDTEQHRSWLRRIARDIAEDQDASGAIREELGSLGSGLFRPPTSNASYGTNEASAIHANGDPMADLLYTCNFTFLGLHEAFAATGEPLYGEMADALAEFLVRIQVRSASHPELDGGWFRTFDYDKWEFWGANADHGWGAWSIEVGWTQGWVTTVLAMRELELNLWDLSADSAIGELWPAVKAEMLPADAIALPETNPVEHLARGAKVVLEREAHPSYPGTGAATLTDGVLGDGGVRSPHWLGFLGDDLVATLDLGEATPIESVTLTTITDVPSGIHQPRAVQIEFSSDGASFLPAGEALLDDGGESWTWKGARPATARWVRVRGENLGVIPAGNPGGGTACWLFVGEILVR